MVNETSKSSKNKKAAKNNNNSNSNNTTTTSGASSSSSTDSAAGCSLTATASASSSKSKQRKSNEYESNDKKLQQSQLQQQQQQQMNGNHHSLADSNDDEDTNSSESLGSDVNLAQEIESASQDENTYAPTSDPAPKLSGLGLGSSGGGLYRLGQEAKTELQEIDLNMRDDSLPLTSSFGKPPPSFTKSPPVLQPPTQTRPSFKSQTSLNSINGSVGSGMKPQRLDSVTLETLDQNICHLILDEHEKLQVKSPEEFINLFKNSKASSSAADLDEQAASDAAGAGISQPASNPLQQPPLQQPATDDILVECVAIFGNTGDGKSHTLNHTFFNGRPIFRTSSKQETCTMGVWCAYDPHTKALIFDTEGLLGTSTNENTRMRLLLKVLAISDVVIYRTRAERLHNDLFQFLSEASVAYTKYFKEELKMAQSKLKLDTISSLGPRCVIFHETQHTDVLCDEMDANGQQRTVSHQLTERFGKLNLCFDAFSSMDYVGTRTYMKSGSLISDNSSSMSTDFTKLAQTVRDYLHNNSVRPPRKLSSIYQALKALNEKFSGKMPEGRISTFADEYFTCSAVCLSCNKRCENSINHLKDGVPHHCSNKCHYDHQYDNKVYVCKQCHEQSGKEVIVIPKTAASNENSLVGIVKYALSGFVLECPHHGIIYRSRQYWYGNQEPETVVRTELKHIWSGQVNNVGTSHNLSRKIIDGVSYLGESLHSVSAKPTKMAMQWMADRVAPTYWTPNSEIVNCTSCHKSFADLLQKKHHCRGCGKGFCDKCSAKRKIIVWWSPTDPVRVCDACYNLAVIPEPPSIKNSPSNSSLGAANNLPGYGFFNPSAGASGSSGTGGNALANSGSTSTLTALAMGAGNNDVIARKVTETVQDTIGFIGYATKIPFDVLKETARPSYWKPDNECTACSICKLEFDDLRPLHHCRSCGDGVCHACSPNQRPVPSRGWDTPVRVCNNCVANELQMASMS